MAVNLFSLEGNLQVGGMPEAKAGLEGITAAGKQTAETLAAAEAAFKKMGMSGATLEGAMNSARRGLGIVGPTVEANATGFARLAQQQAISAAAFAAMPTAIHPMAAAMSEAAGSAVSPMASAMGLASLRTEDMIQKVPKATQAWHEHARGLVDTLERYRGLLEIYGILKLVEFTSEAINQAASLHELSQKTGATVEMLSMLVFAGARADVTAEQLTMGFRGLAIALGNLRDGQEKTVNAFGKLGLASKDFQGLSTDEAFKKIVVAMGQLPDGLDKAEVAARVFGRSGMQLVPLLDDLARDGFDKTTAAAQRFHAQFGQDVADKADHFKDSMRDLHFQLDALARVLIGPLNYGLTNLIKLMTGDLHDEFSQMFKWIDRGVSLFGLLPIPSLRDHYTRKWAVEDSSNPAATGDPGHRAGKVFSPFSGKDDADADKNPEGTEISLLKEKFELNRAGAADLTRLFVLEGQLTQALDGKNLSMKEELRLARDLRDARKAILDAVPAIVAPDTLTGKAARAVLQKDVLDLRDYISHLVAPAPGQGRRGGGIGTQPDLRAGGGMLDQMLKRDFPENPADMSDATREKMERLRQILTQGLQNLQSVGRGFTNLFRDIFSGKGIGESIHNMGKTVLSGLGNVFMQIAAKALAAAPLFHALSKAMANPITAGFALVAFGIALTALGAAMGGAAHSDGGASGGSAGADKITQIHLTADGAGGWMAPKSHDQPVIQVLGVNSPLGQRVFGEYRDKSARRGI